MATRTTSQKSLRFHPYPRDPPPPLPLITPATELLIDGSLAHWPYVSESGGNRGKTLGECPEELHALVCCQPASLLIDNVLRTALAIHVSELPVSASCPCCGRHFKKAPRSYQSWPRSVRAYAARVFDPKNANEEVGRDEMELRLNEIIRRAQDKDTLQTLNWESLALPQDIILAERMQADLDAQLNGYPSPKSSPETSDAFDLGKPSGKRPAPAQLWTPPPEDILNSSDYLLNFGIYEDKMLSEVPDHYLFWLANQMISPDWHGDPALQQAVTKRYEESFLIPRDQGGNHRYQRVYNETPDFPWTSKGKPIYLKQNEAKLFFGLEPKHWAPLPKSFAKRRKGSWASLEHVWWVMRVHRGKSRADDSLEMFLEIWERKQPKKVAEPVGIEIMGVEVVKATELSSPPGVAVRDFADFGSFVFFRCKLGC